MTKYDYDNHTIAELERMIRLAIPVPVRLPKATRDEDLGGVDGHLMLNANCGLQYRCRFDRPAKAADSDITFRVTEPAMIAKGTYAPLMLFVWFRNGYAEAGKLVDIYQLAKRVDLDPRRHRPWIRNKGKDADYFFPITIAELVTADALLRVGGREKWAPHGLGGDQRTLRILNRKAA